MPRTVDVYPEQLHVVTDFTAEEIQHLDIAMNMCQLSRVPKTPEEQAAWDYFTKTFYTYIHQHHDDLKKAK